MRVRTKKSKKNKYYLSKHEFLAVYHYALQYPEWKDEYASIIGKGAGSIGISDSPHTNNISRPTERDGIRAAELSERINRIETAAREAGGDFYPWLILGVTVEGTTFRWLHDKKRLPCERDKYYAMKHHFYWLLAQKPTLGDNNR